jgi:hypothetical protein
MAETKRGRKPKDPKEWRKILVSVRVPLLDMIKGNRTEFINRAMLNELVRTNNIK